MAVDPKIIWLASFPKSGNTWTRIFLHALSTGSEVEELSDFEGSEGIASSKQIHENYLGVDIGDIPEGHVQAYRQEVFKLWNTDLEEEIIVKSHDTPYYKGFRIIPEEVTKKVILIVRNPFDQVASLANHNNCSLQKAVYTLCNEAGILARTKKAYSNQVAQHTSSWGSFYWTWKNTFPHKVSIYRYEDMLDNPVEEFGRMVREIGWDYSKEAIEQAVEATRFDKIKKVEQDKGFKEKPEHTKSFFRSGKVGNWRNEITQEMADHLIDYHYHTLLALKYIDEDRNILV